MIILYTVWNNDDSTDAHEPRAIDTDKITHQKLKAAFESGYVNLGEIMDRWDFSEQEEMADVSFPFTGTIDRSIIVWAESYHGDDGNDDEATEHEYKIPELTQEEKEESQRQMAVTGYEAILSMLDGVEEDNKKYKSTKQQCIIRLNRAMEWNKAIAESIENQGLKHLAPQELIDKANKKFQDLKAKIQSMPD